MSYISFDNAKIIFLDAADKPQELIDLMTPAANKSDLSQADFVDGIQSNLQKLFNGTLEGMISGITFLRIVARLQIKPQVHNVLHIGQWAPLDEVLAQILPKFNAKNFLWTYSSMRPVENIAHVNFVFTSISGGGILFQRINSTR